MKASPSRRRAIATFTILAAVFSAVLAGCSNKSSTLPAAQTSPAAAAEAAAAPAIPFTTTVYTVASNGVATAPVATTTQAGGIGALTTADPAGVQVVATTPSTGTPGQLLGSTTAGASGIATVTLSFSGTKCSLQEASGSPVPDLNTPGLISIGTFPPRSF